MTHRSPGAARAELRAVYQRCLSTITSSVAIVRTIPHSDEGLLRFAEHEAPLQGRTRTRLGVRVWFRTVGVGQPPSWRTVLEGYEYQLRFREGTPLLTYHWHPNSKSPISYPHLHVELRNDAIDLSNAHLPTGYVTLAAVIRMLITEFGVQPLRSDWDAVLAASETVMGDAFAELR